MYDQRYIGKKTNFLRIKIYEKFSYYKDYRNTLIYNKNYF